MEFLKLSTLTAVLSTFYNKLFIGCKLEPVEEIINGLQANLSGSVYGQDIIFPKLLESLGNHLADSSPSKALVMSLHGSPGVGKHFIANKVLHHVFSGRATHRINSVYFSVTNEFPNSKFLCAYEATILENILMTLVVCPSSVFIFDGIDKMHTELLTTLKTIVNHDQARKSTFIFLSNIGSLEISDITYFYKESGKLRNELFLKNLNIILKNAVSLKMPVLLTNKFIDLFLPLLPFDRDIISLCINDAVRIHKSQKTLELVDYVLKELTYDDNFNYIYSTSGCKGVNEAVLRYIGKDLFKYSYSNFKSQEEKNKQKKQEEL